MLVPDEIRDALAPSGRGVVAQLDLADAKRRNSYLGFDLVDRDIEEAPGFGVTSYRWSPMGSSTSASKHGIII